VIWIALGHAGFAESISVDAERNDRDMLFETPWPPAPPARFSLHRHRSGHAFQGTALEPPEGTGYSRRDVLARLHTTAAWGANNCTTSIPQRIATCKVHD
jgi:hypothetical protein